MAVNKVIYHGNTLIDLTSSTVTPGALALGVTAKNAKGETITGTVPVIGAIDGSNIVLSGTLANGLYAVKSSDGKAIGNWRIGPAYTNQIPISIDTNGSVYNGKGWIENKRLNSSGVVSDVGTYGYTGVTGFIPIANGDVIRTSANMVATNGSEQQAVHFYKADKTFIARRRFIISSGKFENTLYTLNADNSFVYRHNDGWTDISGAAYIRVCMGGITDGAIITRNEEIV